MLPHTSLLVLLVLACSGSSGQKSTAPGIKKSEPLGVLMKDQINPSFTKLSFLVFHGDTMDEEPAALDAEIARNARVLASGTSQLREWTAPPTETAEGREVFLTYAASVDKTAQQLVDAVGRKDAKGTAAAMEQIAKTCNSCHHFFRLDLEDSVVGAGTAPAHSP